MSEPLYWQFQSVSHQWWAKSYLVNVNQSQAVYKIRVTAKGQFITDCTDLIIQQPEAKTSTLDEAKACCELRERQIREEAKLDTPRITISIECSNAREWTVKSPSITGMMADQLDAGEALVLVAALIMTPECRKGIIDGLSKPI